MAKWKPNQEQVDARKRKQEKLRELTKRVADMTGEERSALSSKISIMNTEGHPLSMANQILIGLQREGCTIVGGFKQWIKMGRCVKSGETGLNIWIPRSQKEDENKQPGEMSSMDESPGFFMGTVFDVSQTVELENHG